MRLYRLFNVVILVAALCLAGCGDDEESTIGSDASEPGNNSDASDQADSADPSDTSDPSDSSDASDEADPSDSPLPQGMNCTAYLLCVDDCWTTEPANPETCMNACDESAAPEALEAARAYYECMDDCEEGDGAEEDVEICFQEQCSPLYNRCIAPPACIPACEHYDEICGEDGPLHGQRTYVAGGTRYTIHTSTQEVIIALHDMAQTTPDLVGIDRLELHDTLDSKHMLVAHFDSKRISPATFEHPAIRTIYPVFTNSRGVRLISTDEVIFHAPSQTPTQLRSFLEQAKMNIIRPVKGLSQTWLARTRIGDSISASDRLLSSNLVKWASPNFLRQYELKYIPNDPYFPDQWHHLNQGDSGRSLAGADMRTTLAWDITTGDAAVSIAVNDDGVDLRHSDIPFLRNSDMEILGVNLPSSIDDALAQGCCQHGTSVAGVSAAIADNDIGTAGVCPGCSVMPVWTDFSSPSEDLAVAETFTESTGNGAWAINNSWGPPDGNPAVLEAPAPFEPVPDIIDQALVDAAENGRSGKGTVVVFAAGNGNEDVLTDAFAAHPLTIAVAAVNSRGIKSSYSDFGDAIWVAAPSSGNHLVKGIVTTDVLGDLGYAVPGTPDALDPEGDVTSDFGGTSSAAPAVTGLVGLIFSANPVLTALQVKDILRRTSRKIDKAHGQYQPDEDGFLKSPFYGYGLVDAHAAIRAAHIGCVPEETEICLPAATCEDGPLPLVPEACNGVDDNCDGVTDEDACPETEPTGEPCDLTGGCQDNCTWLENDPVPYCPDLCVDDDCPEENHICESGLCVPESGRFSGATDEVCDGYDNNIDGEIDELGCEPSADATCEYTQQCDDSNGPIMCVEGFCAPVCEATDECDAGIECQEVASQYGTGTDTSICAPSLSTGLTCIDACIFLHENAPSVIFQSITNCITEAATCDDAIACVPL